VEGMVEHSSGTSRLERLSGLARESGFLALLFLLSALSLSGIPPFSGFVAKLGLVTAGFDAGEGVLVAVAIACSLLTLVSMTKIWLSAFWGESAPGGPVVEPGAAPPRSTLTGTAATGAVAVRPAPVRPVPARLTWPAPMTLATVTLVSVGVVVALAAGPLYALCERAAGDLVTPAPHGTVVGDR